MPDNLDGIANPDSLTVAKDADIVLHKNPDVSPD
jgi:hypothetical protein